MFESMQLKYFRKCVDESMHFGPGLNVIRGMNESSKSTRFEAMAYAMFGVDALREPLADVVTWGEKESSLKVTLKLVINTNQVTIRRGKSGAEIDVDGKLVATGQKEVTRFVEGLLGAAPKVAAKLMLANQTSLRGALADGPTATAQLIEQLSNFALIDEIIQLVVEHLPSGNTAVLEQQVSSLGKRLETEKPVEPDVAAYDAAIAVELAHQAEDQAGLAEANADLPAAKAAAEAGRSQARALEAAMSKASEAGAGLTRTEAALARLQPQSSVTPEQVEALQTRLADEHRRQDAAAAWAAMSNLAVPEDIWEGSREDFDAAVAKARASSTDARDKLGALDVRHAEVAGRLIKESSCAFCGKDLKDVPEVAQVNSALGAELAAISGAREGLVAFRGVLQGEIEAYDAISRADRNVRDVFARHHAFMKLVEATVPPTLEWSGPDLSAPSAPMDALRALNAAKAEIQRAAQDQGQKTALEVERDRLQAVFDTSQAWVADLQPKVAADRSSGLEQDLLTKVRYHEGRLAAQTAAIASARMAIDHAQRLHQVQVTAYAGVQTDYEKAQANLEETQLNNVLIKKLRGARPKVADKLWSIVLSTVGHYFSAIRGTQSVVTRDESGFKVDGKPVPGLSGSTLDALGLAIRIALTKTFLPNIDFLVLDEPASACDDDRETNMLGVITTAGFAQVLLVTHSTLADAFADQVVTL